MTALPVGFAVRLSPDTLACGRTLVGGSSGQVLRLRPRAEAMLDGDRLTVRDAASAKLAAILLDRGLADPVWEGSAEDRVEDVTVVVPVRDRPVQLARLLDALPRGVPVVVVDDGSMDAGPTATIAANRGARLVRHPHDRGPAAARNTGLAAVRTTFVVFVDSDVEPVPGWLGTLRRHFEDPLLGAVAPRVLGREHVETSWLGRYEAARSSLDLGPTPASVRPHARVSYVPSATLMARVEALAGGFEESMRVAEDVDAIWRLCESGWRVRYEPLAVVRHDHRTQPGAWLRRRAFYGTGAGPLAIRHGGAVAPMVLTPWTTALSAAVLAQRRWSVPVAALVCAGTTAVTAYRLRAGERPVRTAATITLIGAVATAHQTASALTRHYWPLTLAAAMVSRRARRAVVVAGVLDGLLDHRRTRPDLDPARYLVALRLDDLAYGAGLWAGAVRSRAPRALLPLWRGRPRAMSTPPPRERQHHGQEPLVRNGR